MEFEWDPDKASENERKHGVSFEEAATAFGDPLSLAIRDPDHSDDEFRFILVGESYAGRLVVVVHAERGPESASSALDWLPDESDGSMNPEEDSMREEYDFSGGVRGKYADRFAEGSNVVVLDPDVAAAFTTREAVNDALRERLGRKEAGEEEAG